MDVVIPLSVTVVGGWGILGGSCRWDVFTGVVLAFGLVHGLVRGLGLATRFQALDVPEDGELWRLIAFNVGIEIGQVTAVFAMQVLATTLGGRLRGAAVNRTITLALAGLFVIGNVGASLLAYQAFTGIDGEVQAQDLSADTSCTVSDRPVTVRGVGGGHPAQQFYDPDQSAPLADFGHSLGDGYIVVLQPGDLSTTDVEALRDLVESDDLDGLLAGADPESDEVVAITQDQELRCTEVDMTALEEISRAWLESIRVTP